MDVAELESPVRPGRLPLALAVLGVGVALALGLAAGNPTPATLVPAVLVTGTAVMVTALARPFGAFLVLAASTIFLMVFSLPGNHGLNAFDLLLPSLLVASLFGTARSEALAEDRRMTDARHQELHTATRHLGLAVLVFYGIAALSIVIMAPSGGTSSVENSTTSLARAFQGLLLFPLGLWWLRTERRIHMTIRAMLVGGILFAVVNSVAVGLYGVRRAGLIWWVNEPGASIAGPNDSGAQVLRQSVH